MADIKCKTCDVGSLQRWTSEQTNNPLIDEGTNCVFWKGAIRNDVREDLAPYLFE